MAGFQVISVHTHDLTVREYKRRKRHTKTTSGCLTCKSRRVKCDESRPRCLACRKGERRCEYGPPKSRLDGHDQEIDLVSPNNPNGPSSFSSVTVEPFPLPSNPAGISGINLLQHFHNHCSDIFHMPGINEIVSLSQSNQLVRNAILAVSASHLRHKSPRTVEHRITDHYQQAIALRDYQRALDMPREQLGQRGVDPLIVCAVMLNIIAFTVQDEESAGCDIEDPSTSWVFSPLENRLGWLALQAGLKVLMICTTLYLESTLHFLGTVFLGPEQPNPWAFRKISVGLGLDNVPDQWRQFFELEESAGGCDCESPRPRDVYRSPVILLMALRILSPPDANIFLMLQFMGKVQTEFRALLYRRDEKALWIFGYWLGLLSRFKGIWWCETRARRDYKAIRMWLDQLHVAERPGKEGEQWREMMHEYEMAPSCIDTPALLSSETASNTNPARN